METIWIIRRLFSAQGMQERFHPLELLLLFALPTSWTHLVAHDIFFIPGPDASVRDQSLIWGPHTYRSQAFHTWPLSPSKGWLRCAGLCYQPTKNLPLPFFHVRGGNSMPTQLTSPSPPLKPRALWRWETFQERNTIRLFEMELLGNQSISASSGVYSCYLTCFCTPLLSWRQRAKSCFISASQCPPGLTCTQAAEEGGPRLHLAHYHSCSTPHLTNSVFFLL